MFWLPYVTNSQFTFTAVQTEYKDKQTYASLLYFQDASWPTGENPFSLSGSCFTGQNSSSDESYSEDETPEFIKKLAPLGRSKTFKLLLRKIKGNDLDPEKTCLDWILTHVLSTLVPHFALSILYELTVAKTLCNDEQDTGLKFLYVW